MPQIRVHPLPGLIPSECDLSDSCCVVIDVLRATTSMVMALEAGARSIRPFESIDEAREFAAANSYLLAGERQGLKIEGFDLGNSPLEFTSEKVGGRKIAMTTTNGTKALMACKSARQVIVAAFVNLSAVCELVSSRESQVDIVCAGTDGEVTIEDNLLAGAIVERCVSLENGNDHVRQSVDLWKSHQLELESALMNSKGGKNLLKISRGEDIRFASQIDLSRLLPKMADGEIRAF